MSAYQRFFLAYVNAIKKRNNALTEGEWYEANEKVKKIKFVLDKLAHK